MIGYEHVPPSHIFGINEKVINSAVYDLGTKYNRISEGLILSSLVSDHYAVEEKPIKQYYISPTTPFSNVYNMRKALRSCSGNIYWIDKHFRKEGLEIVLDGLAYEGVRSLTIISGTDNATESAKKDYLLLRQELSERSVSLAWQIITDTTFKWHDRWIVADNCCYNVPPVFAIIRGQRADILKTDVILDVMPFLEASTNIIVDIP